MIHRARGGAFGNPDEIEGGAEALRTMEDMIAEIYAEKTGLNIERIQEMLANETWLTGEEAHEMGFADSIVGQGSSQNRRDGEARGLFAGFNGTIHNEFKNVPKVLEDGSFERIGIIPGNALIDSGDGISGPTGPQGEVGPIGVEGVQGHQGPVGASGEWRTLISHEGTAPLDTSNSSQQTSEPSEEKLTNMDIKELKDLLEGLNNSVNVIKESAEKNSADIEALTDLVQEPKEEPKEVAPEAKAEEPKAEEPKAEKDSSKELLEMVAKTMAALNAKVDKQAEDNAAAVKALANAPAPEVVEPEAAVKTEKPPVKLDYFAAFKADKEVNEFGYDFADLANHAEFGIQLATAMEMKYGTPAQYEANGGKPLPKA